MITLYVRLLINVLSCDSSVIALGLNKVLRYFVTLFIMSSFVIK